MNSDTSPTRTVIAYRSSYVHTTRMAVVATDEYMMLMHRISMEMS